MGEQKIEPQLLELGKLFEDKFEILSVLGRGANGVVYKARHLLLQTFVALKVINQNSSDPELAAQRFQKEATLLSSFDHPNIVKLHSYGVLPDGRQYMALEFVEGESLSEQIAKSGALEYSRAIAIFEQICGALSYSHSRGVVHRDIKPANVMLDADGKARILDFGIFKSLDNSSQSLTKTGYLLGSANYMSPEQCKQQDIDDRSDIYSFGCLMYECLVGQPPMQDSSDMAIMANQMEKVIDHVPARRGISKKLEETILRCLAKDPSRRFPSASELERVLRDCAQAPLLERAEARNNRKWLFVSIAVASLIILCGLASWRYWQDQQTKKAITNIAPTTQSSLQESGRMLPPEGNRTVKATEQRERWIAKNGSHEEQKKLIEQYALCWQHRRDLGRPVPPPHGEIVKARLEYLLANSEVTEGRYGLLRDLAFLSAMLADDSSVEKYISELEKRGESLYEANRRKALNAAIFNVVTIYQELGRDSDGLLLLKREDATGLSGDEKIIYNDGIAMNYVALKDIESARPFALQSASLLKSQMDQGSLPQPNVIYSVVCRLNQVQRPDLVFEIVGKLPPITGERKRADPNWRHIECELANSYLYTNQLEKAKQIYLSNIGEIRNSEPSEQVLSAERVLLTILYKQNKKEEVITQARNYLETVPASSYVTASRQIVNILVVWKIDASSLEPLILAKAKASEGLDPSRSHRLYETLGKIFLCSGNSKKASAYYEQAQKLAASAGNEQGVAAALTGKMTCLIYENKLSEFMAARQSFLQLRDVSLDDRFTAEELMGLFYQTHKDLKKAIEIYEKLLSEAEPQGRRDHIPSAYCDCALHLAMSYKELGKDDKALQAAERGITAAKTARKHTNADILYDYAAYLCQKSNPQKAAKYRRTASKLRKV